MSGALDGVRVLELAHLIAGPHCTQILADHGADVIKVEPLEGDRTRGALPVLDGQSLYFAAHNRGKRSLAMNLKAPEGREIFLRLADNADVLVTNFGLDVPDRLGLSFPLLSERNERLVVAQVSGFGSRSAYRDLPAYDGVIQSMSGIPDLTGWPDSAPTMVGAFVADHVAAHNAAMGVLLALFERQRTGRGQYVDVSMLDGFVGMLAHHVGEVVNLDKPATRMGNQVRTAFANIYPAADGYLYLGPVPAAKWPTFQAAAGLPAWVAELSVGEAVGERRADLEAAVSEWVSARSRAEALAALQEAGIACAPVNSIDEIVTDPDLVRRDVVTRVHTEDGQELGVPGPTVQVGLDTGPRSRAVPAVGQHTREVLREAGYADHQVDECIAGGVVACPKN